MRKSDFKFKKAYVPTKSPNVLVATVEHKTQCGSTRFTSHILDYESKTIQEIINEVLRIAKKRI